ncbi:hypothetical protein NFI96_005429 [Prochilodus magdalenae]|nr:hypothetical protein NFI96_005429 [Prochilodus magdalenae]
MAAVLVRRGMAAVLVRRGMAAVLVRRGMAAVLVRRGHRRRKGTSTVTSVKLKIRHLSWSKVNAAIYQEVLEHFMLPAAHQLYGDADFIFQQDLAPAHRDKAASAWFKDHGIPVLNWPANSPDLNPLENLWGMLKRKMRNARPNNAEELKATISATWALITPEQCHRLIDSMPRRISAVIQTSQSLVPVTTTVQKSEPMSRGRRKEWCLWVSLTISGLDAEWLRPGGGPRPMALQAS